ncbi:MAG: hypothetical protein R3277_01560 [Brumimicrobium sp.]|nr:hypothetical protein [Brumimicrobium sp.]
MKPQLFDFIDVIIGSAWIILIVIIGWTIYLKNKDRGYYKFFLPNLLFKLFFGLFFGITYSIILSEGGDTLAYWEGAYNLNQLFWESPWDYFQELFITPDQSTITEHFNRETGYPPIWIYREPESFFVCKILSVFTFFTLNSYIALTIVCAGISAYASWRLFTLVKDFEFCPQWVLIIACLFLPTVAFWCSGISKDTFVLSSLYLLVFQLFTMIQRKRKLNPWNIFLVVFHVFILYHLRSFMLIAVFGPLIFAFTVKIFARISSNQILAFSLRLVLFSSLLFAAFGYLSSDQFISNNPYLKEVTVIQQDFAQNVTYTGYRYDLGINDYTPQGMLAAAPMALITAFFRPFLWEANSVFLLVSALEGTILLFFVFRFFFLNGNIFKHLNYIRKQEFLVFSIIFVLLLGFFVGFSSGLFNVLVRFKAPLMVFLFIFFASRRPKFIG